MVLDHIPGHRLVTDASPERARVVCHDHAVRDALRLTGFVLLCIIWGSTWLVIKVGYGGLGPLNVAGVRFAIAAVVLTILVPLVGARWPRGKAEWTLIVFVGVLLFLGDYGLIYWAEQYIDSGLTAILFGTFPLLTMAFAHVYVPGEHLTGRKLAGGIAASLGVAALFGDRVHIDASNVGPMAAIVAAAACAAVANVATKRHGGAIHSAALNASTMLIGAVLLLAAAWLTGEGVRLPPDAASWAAVTYLALVGSVVAFLIYFSLLKTWKATTVSFFGVFTPAIALLLGAAILRERLTVWSLVGSVLILVGVSTALTTSRAPAPVRARV
jgi:drug/metabolite transporter (DMT)-like permease